MLTIMIATGKCVTTLFLVKILAKGLSKNIDENVLRLLEKV